MTAFPNFRSAVQSLDLSRGLPDWPEALLMRRDGDWATFYAPFDHVNVNAKIVLVGITPGLQQASNALAALQQGLRNGHSDGAALEAAKRYASFSGPMRQNLVDMLDFIGLALWLGVESTAALFSDHAHLVHYTSALRYPVTLRGKNYGGTPSLVRTPFTREELRWFAEEAESLPQAVFVPLGPAATEATDWLAQRGVLDRSRVLGGLPHPSGANAERIAYFLGRKSREKLSAKTDPGKLDRARDDLVAAVGRL
jgi:hypothetical protein